MRGKLRRWDRLQNLLILVLAVLALLLISKTGFFQNMNQAGGLGGGGAAAEEDGPRFSQNLPVTLAVQTPEGRYGVQYDQQTMARLYDGGLREALAQAMSTMGTVQSVSQQEWQEAVSQGERWVFYDFLYNISFSGQSEGAARFFLLTLRGERAETLYFYNQASGSYYSAAVEGSAQLEALLAGLTPDGSLFAFEAEELDLPGYQLVKREAPGCQVYTASTPLSDIDAAAREALLERLNFNTKASSPYETADGIVIREGMDTLRLQKDGKLIFHGTESGEARYQAASTQDRDLQRQAEEILEQVAVGRGQFYCQGITSLGDGVAEVTFYYLLGGARVNLWEKDCSARFTFQDSALVHYEISLRDYEPLEEHCAVPPLRQAAAAAAAEGQGGKELQICYRDDGGERVQAGWAVRVQE